MGGTMRWAELRMCRFWAGGISSFPFSRAREYRLLRRLAQIRENIRPVTIILVYFELILYESSKTSLC